MLQHKKILTVVPARGGSKGVKLKNIHPLNGKPLIVWTGKLINRLPYIDRAVVSTDHPEIANIAMEAGLAAPFVRPLELSGDRIGDAEVLTHALQQMECIDDTRYDVVVMMQPTCPLRRAHHVTCAVKKLIEYEWDSVWTVSPTDLKYHPLKQLRLTDSGAIDYYLSEGTEIIARQQLDPIYHRNGAAYAISRRCLLDWHTIKGKRSGCVIIDEPMVSIDTLEDFEKVEAIMQQDNLERNPVKFKE